MSFLGTFEHTTGTTWGGTQLDPGTLKFATVLGGFFGIDHLLLRSPRTALFKFILNLLTFGFWYWYDILQVFGDLDSVKRYGYTVPIYGPVGLGAGILHDSATKAAPEDTPTPLTFFMYMLFVFLPFGISNVIAGDSSGGFMKILFSIVFWPFILVAILWSIYSGFYAVFNTESLLTRGTDRMFPFSLLLGSYGSATNLKPPNLTKAEAFESSWWSMIPGGSFLMSFFRPVEKAALQTVVAVGDPALNVAETLKDQAVQTGGALLSDDTGISKALFLGAFALVFVGATFVTGARFLQAKKPEDSKQTERNDIPPEGFTDDVPPGPRLL